MPGKKKSSVDILSDELDEMMESLRGGAGEVSDPDSSLEGAIDQQKGTDEAGVGEERKEADKDEDAKSLPAGGRQDESAEAGKLTEDDFNRRLDELQASVEERDKLIESLRGQLSESFSEVEQIKSMRPAKQETRKETEPVGQPGKDLTSIEFISKQQADELLDKPYEVLNAIFRTFGPAIVKASREGFMTELPGMIEQTARQQLTVMDAARDFYRKNPDLAPYARVVSAVAQQVEGSNPGKAGDTQWLFDESARIARQRLGLPAQKQQDAAQQQKADSSTARSGPAFAGSQSGTRRPKKSDIPDVTKQILELAQP